MAEAVDALLDVTDHEHIVPGDGQKDRLLDAARILVFIDVDLLVALAVISAASG
jgi:nucleotide-binding universal stress UspA family protein